MDALVRTRPTRPLTVAIAAVLLTTCAGPRGGAAGQLAATGERRSFPVLQFGALDLPIPGGWKVSVLELEPGTPTSIRLDAPGGGALFVAPLYEPDLGEGSRGLDSARAFAELARLKASGSATEARPALSEVTGSDGRVRGYWFVATDRDYVKPAPGQPRWRNMMRGAVSVGRLLVSFTWFDDRAGPEREQVLAMVADARHAGPGPEPRADAPGGGPGGDALRFTPDPEARTVPLAVGSPGGSFTVLVDLPGFQMFAPRPPPDGEGVLVLGQHPDSGVVASVTIAPARGEGGARACRDRKVEALRKAAPDLADLRVSDAGPAARASYVLQELRGEKVRQEHAHAFLERDAWCVDVQVSKAGPVEGDPERLEGILATARFAASL